MLHVKHTLNSEGKFEKEQFWDSNIPGPAVFKKIFFSTLLFFLVALQLLQFLRCHADLWLLLPALCSQANRKRKAGCNNTNFQISVLILIRVRNSPCESATARMISNSSSRERHAIFGSRATRAKSLTINLRACSLISKIFV